MSPIKNVCLLCEEPGSAPQIFLGSCFAFRDRKSFLTAAHCISNRDESKLVVVNPYTHQTAKVFSVAIHSSADLAVITLETNCKDVAPIEPIATTMKLRGIGGEYCAYGYPEDSIGPNAGTPTARIFRGYGQRVFLHRSHMPYSYTAVELSFPCPGGLSGGPLFKPKTFQLVGLVTENIETTTSLYEDEIVYSNGQRLTNHYRRVINYGLGLLLHEHENWLNNNVDPRADPA
jgi:S1-C subfamily serine protease